MALGPSYNVACFLHILPRAILHEQPTVSHSDDVYLGAASDPTGQGLSPTRLPPLQRPIAYPGLSPWASDQSTINPEFP